ncbi:MAG: NAD-dependent epimerase/dehydratase family protein [Acidobacteriota bacterium]
MKILIAGAGDIGIRLGLLWAGPEHGHEVWALRRSAAKVPAPLRPFGADLTEPSTLDALPDDFDLVYYTAAADGPGEQAYRRAYVDGLRSILDRVLSPRRARPSRIVFISSTSVYGQSAGEWVDESTRAEPSSYRGRILLEGEALLGARGAAHGVDTVAVRLSGIYGPGRTRLLDSIRTGRAVIYDDPPRYTNRIHADDCARLLHHLGAVAAPESVYIGVDHDPATDGEVKTWLAEQLGVPAPPSVGDRPEAKAGGRRGGNKRCSNRRVLDSGFRFTYPDFRAGYGEEIRRLVAPPA